MSLIRDCAKFTYRIYNVVIKSAIDLRRDARFWRRLESLAVR